MPIYDQLARFYDLTHEALTADRAFIGALAAEASGLILELGCGTGRVLLPLARAGHTVTGVDSSAAMLARARQRLAAEPEAVRARVALVEAEMAALPDDGRFALVLIAYNTAMHLSPADLRVVLRRVRRALREDGRLFIDVANPYALADLSEERLLAVENVLTDVEAGETILQMSSSWPDETAQQVHVLWLYDAIPAGGGAVQRTAVQMVYHYLFPHEWELALREAGLRLVQLAGDYDGAPFTEESPRLLLTAEYSAP